MMTEAKTVSIHRCTPQAYARFHFNFKSFRSLEVVLGGKQCVVVCSGRPAYDFNVVTRVAICSPLLGKPIPL